MPVTLQQLQQLLPPQAIQTLQQQGQLQEVLASVNLPGTTGTPDPARIVAQPPTTTNITPGPGQQQATAVTVEDILRELVAGTLTPEQAIVNLTQGLGIDQAAADIIVAQVVKTGVSRPTDTAPVVDPVPRPEVSPIGAGIDPSFEQRLLAAEAAPTNVFQRFLSDVLPGGIGPRARGFAENQFNPQLGSFFASQTPESFGASFQDDIFDPGASSFRGFLRQGQQALSPGGLAEQFGRLGELFNTRGNETNVRGLSDLFTDQRVFNIAKDIGLAGVNPLFRSALGRGAERSFASFLGGGPNQSFLNFLNQQGGRLFG